jgi:hypothetical protein
MAIGVDCASALRPACRASIRRAQAPWITRRVGLRFGSCAAAACLNLLERQVTVADIAVAAMDALWECRRDAARHAGLAAAWSIPIVASDNASSVRYLPSAVSPERL